jgi:hypothetical protein
VSRVDALLELHEQLESAESPRVYAVLERQIFATDQEIDDAVFDLYGLPQEERDEVKELLAD